MIKRTLFFALLGLLATTKTRKKVAHTTVPVIPTPEAWDSKS